MAVSTAFNLTSSGTTGVAVYYGDFSDANSLLITRGDCKVSITPITTLYGEIPITYTLENDRETTCSIRPYYSVDGGSTFTECTKGTGGDNKTGLATSSAGTSHTFIWNSYSDLGNNYVGDIFFKIRAYDHDNYVGDYLESYKHKILVNNAPDAPTLVSPTSSWFQKDDTPEFIMEIPSDNNPSGVFSKLHAKIEVDKVNTFNSSSLAVFESVVDQAGWEYENASSTYIAFPEDGIPVTSELVGNYVRYVPSTEKRLDKTILNWRAYFGAA